jgi:lipid-binding SYLF domain-containing protein
MHRTDHLAAFVVAWVFLTHVSNATAQYAEEETVRAAATVLNETMATPLNQIPQSMLQNASGVAIIPHVIKGSFIVGARRGHGVLFVKEADGIWHAPVFITLTGGNIGWQVGVQSSDIVLVFKTRKSIQGILSGKLTLGADAAAAAGPLGRQAALATDETLQAEIYSYSRSRGLFAGVSIDGSVVQIDRLSTGAYYRSAGPGQPVIVPPSAQQLTQTIAAYAGNPRSTIPAQNHVFAQQYGAREADVLRAQLGQIAPQLFALLDDQWKSYLALPASLFLEGGHTSPDQLRVATERFDLVATDARFRQLASRPEFQSVYGLLKHYQQSLSANSSELELPPPPGSGQTVPR